jgi:hypothetical protein
MQCSRATTGECAALEHFGTAVAVDISDHPPRPLSRHGDVASRAYIDQLLGTGPTSGPGDGGPGIGAQPLAGERARDRRPS